MYDYDYLITCPRCKNQDADIREGICWGCQRELLDHHDHKIGWQEAYQLELDETLLQRLKADPDYASTVLTMFDLFSHTFKNDPETLAIISKDHSKFIDRLKRVAPKYYITKSITNDKQETIQ